jgi:LysR family transcriptional regulator, nitrogen assimilation regulatory protein
MNPDHLEYFLRVAELGSINRAAQDLHLSQPALSRHIAALEHAVQARLFNRTSGGVRLTEAGAVLRERALPILRDISALRKDVGSHAVGQVTLGVPAAWQRIVTAPLVARIVGERPNVFLRVYEAINNVLRDHMAAGQIDLGVVAFAVPLVSGYARTPLVREPLMLVGDARAGLQPGVEVALSRLRHTKIILPGRPNVIRQQIEHVLSRHRHPFRIAVEAETLSLCLELTRQGLGYTVMPYCALHEHPYAKEISWAPIRRLSLAWVLAENKERSYSPAVQDTRRLLLEEVERQLRGQRWPGAERPN